MDQVAHQVTELTLAVQRSLRRSFGRTDADRSAGTDADRSLTQTK
jgi:hypothetical protein